MTVGIRIIAVATALALFAAGCAESSSSRYSSSDIGQIIETAEGTVVSSQVVDIKKDKDPGYGAGGGGSGSSSGSSGNLSISGGGPILAVVGLLTAVGAGMALMDSGTESADEGFEYMVRMDDGRIVTLVQEREGEEEPIANGTPVLVQYGSEHTRIVPDPTALYGIGTVGAGPGGTWKNPDETLAAPPGGSDKGGPSGSEPTSPAVQ